jgi:hypothetical protein
MTGDWLKNTQTALASAEYGKALKICTNEFLDNVTPTTDLLQRLGKTAEQPLPPGGDESNAAARHRQVASILEETILSIIETSKPVHMCTMIIELSGGLAAPKIEPRSPDEIMAVVEHERSAEGGPDMEKYYSVVKGAIITTVDCIKKIINDLQPPQASLDDFVKTLHRALTDFHKCITSMTVAFHLLSSYSAPA